MKKIINLILRILVSPAILLIVVVKYNYVGLKTVVLFLIYGGEWTNYMDKDEGRTIQEIYKEIKSQRK